MRSPNHPNEIGRLEALKRLAILDTSPEELFDDYALIATEVCGTPIAQVCFVDQKRQWFKARIGISVCETSRDVSFCSHAILGDGPLVVSDASGDPRFADSDLVTGQAQYRFYLGVPITFEGYPVGTICVADTQPRDVSPEQIGAMRAIARRVSASLETRVLHAETSEVADMLAASQMAVKVANNRFSELFHGLAVPCLTTNREGAIFDFNRKAEYFFGTLAHQVVGKNLVDLFVPAEFRHEARGVLDRLGAGEEISNLERPVTLPDGTEVWTLINVRPVRDLEGNVVGTIGSFVDISERREMEAKLKEANERLSYLALTDSLTPTANRRSILGILNHELANRSRSPVAVVLLDVDNFKSFNDTFGHSGGDEVLGTVAEILLECVRPGDSVGRFGGEEFLVVLRDSNIATASVVAERLRASLEAHAWPLRKVTASFGVATSDECEGGEAELIRLADDRLYQAKAAGRNCVVAAAA